MPDGMGHVQPPGRRHELFPAARCGTPTSFPDHRFPGKRKTALINQLLRFPEMARTAILINEFGDVALDQLFVEASDGDVTVLPNGCLCCDVRGDLEGAIGTLFGRRR